jgi:ketosteroid isomerase-like protein
MEMKLQMLWGAGNLLEVLQKESGGSGDPAAVTVAANGAVEALNRRDANAYANHLHPDFTMFLPQQSELLTNDTESMVENFKNGLNFNMQLGDLKVAFYGNTAVVTGYETGTANFTDGRTLEGKRKYTSVWVNQNRQWKEVHLHISMVEGKD